MKTAGKIFEKSPLVELLLIFLISSLACNVSIKPVEKQSDKPTTEAKVVEEVFPTSTSQPLPPTDLPPTRTPPLPTTEVKIRPTATIAEPTKSNQIKPATHAPQPSVTPMLEGVTVTAATGNMFIRRGPGSTYNIIAGLSKGVTAKAVGRSEKNDWLAIEIPNANGKVGWISMGTIFTQLNGSMQALSLYPFEVFKPAYLRNCTLHDMTTKPGQWNLPAKTTQKVNPGEYKILDMSTGQSGVQDVDLKEGNTISIKVDGNGLSNSCP